MQKDLSKRVNTQNLQSSVQRSGQLEFLVQDGNEHIDAHSDPDLSLHCVGRNAEEVFDAQVLFDPAKEASKARQNASGSPKGGAERHQQFDLPTIQIKRGRSFGVQAFLDVAQTHSPGQLRKAHADQLLPTTEVTCANVVALDQSVEGLAVNQIQDLGEDIATRVHSHRSC